MRFTLFIVLTVIFSAISTLFLPWWMIAVVPFLISLLMKQKGGKSFLGGFIAIAAFWFAAALMKDAPNNHLLSQRMAVLFHLSDYGLLMCIVAVLGGLVGGLAAWSGSLISNVKK